MRYSTVTAAEGKNINFSKANEAVVGTVSVHSVPLEILFKVAVTQQPNVGRFNMMPREALHAIS